MLSRDILFTVQGWVTILLLYILPEQTGGLKNKLTSNSTTMITLRSILMLLFFMRATQSSLLTHQYPSPVPELNKRNRYKKRTEFRSKSACRIFVWDALSACRYHLCNYLLKDAVYEGLGGRKFVRIKPGSILESLYPPSNHGSDKCLICGLSFRDHLQSWWYPHLYSSYDRYLDETQRDGIKHDNDNSGPKEDLKVKQKKENKKRRSILTQKGEFESGLSPICSTNDNTGKFKTSRRFSYHSSYVTEINKPYDQNINNECKSGERKRNKQVDKDGHEALSVAGINYSVPKVQLDKNKVLGDFLLITARVFTLSKLDQLLWIERFESNQ